MRLTFARSALRPGALPLIATMIATALGGCGSDSDGPAPPDGSVPQHDFLTEQRLGDLAAELSSDAMEGRDEGSPGHEAARATIIARLQACGVQPAPNGGFEQPITTGTGVNVLGLVPGGQAGLAQRFVLLGAHYDHLGANGTTIYPGAGDNAAAVSILVGVACELVRAPTARSVLVASWDSEEPPTFMTDAMGSEFFAANPLVALDAIDVAIALDLVGLDMWPGFAGHVVCGAELSPGLTAVLDAASPPEGLLARRAGLHLVEQLVTGEVMRWSDYAAFLERARPVLFFSDGTNKNYHRPTDTFATLDVPKMQREALYLLDVVTRLGAMDALPSFDASGADHATDASTTSEFLELALAPGGLVESLGLSATSRTDLEADLAAAQAAKATLDAGGALSSTQVVDLRRGVQRIMCLAGTMYTQPACHLM